jgi:hypothetical protein
MTSTLMFLSDSIEPMKVRGKGKFASVSNHQNIDWLEEVRSVHFNLGTKIMEVKVKMKKGY